MTGKEILNRLCEEVGVKNMSQLASKLNVSSMTLYGYMKKDDVPPHFYMRLLEQLSLSPSWVRTGEGPKFLGPTPEDAPVLVTLEHLPTSGLIDELQRRLPGNAVILSPIMYRADIDAGQ